MTLSSLLTNPNRKPSAAAINSRLARTLPSSPLSQYSSSSILSSPLPSSSPPTEFASPFSPPVLGQGRARLGNHEEMLRRLDEVYGRNEHPMLDGFRFIGAGAVGNPWPRERQARVEDDDEDDGGGGGGSRRMGEPEESRKPTPVVDDGRWKGDMNDGVEVRAQKAMKVLENHIRDRMPYVRAASMRLQAVMGLRNELPFDLPELRRPTPSHFNGFSPNSSPLSYTPDAGAAARTLARNGFSCSPYNFNTLSPLSPLNTPNVDPQTGKGLREWLLSKGKEFGMRKKECRSISFHDFTPDMRNNNWSNKLLGHFVGEGARERVDFYEVDLPTTVPDPTTGRPISTTQTWLWFLISRPLLTINPKNTSTRPPSQSKISHPSSVQSTPQTFHTPATYPSSSPTPRPAAQTPTQHQNNGQGGNTLPPNFPLPVPTSWMVFACPLENVTAYPETIESAPPSNSTSSSIPPPLRQRNQFPSNNGNGNGWGKKIHKRRDFDISHNGIPLFEFSLPNSSPFPHAENLPSFLEVGELGPFYQGDEFEAYEEAEYEEIVQEAAAQKNWLGDEIPGSGAMVPSPNSGYWWKVFYALVEQDAECWQSVKNAMGRGKCRVVVRYEEFEGDVELMGEGGGVDGDVEMEMEDRVYGLGIEFEDGGGGGALGVGKKKERLVGRQRVTRSEARRRSGLGLSEVSSGGVVMGVGAQVGESARARAVGNKDLSVAGVAGVGVGKGGMKGGGKK